MKDTVNETIQKIINRIIKVYGLNPKEAEELKIATYNYDYESNDGAIFTERKYIEALFTEADSPKRIPYTEKQLKALAEYIYETGRFYSLSPDRELDKYTKKTVLDILSDKSKSKIEDRKNNINKNYTRGR